MSQRRNPIDQSDIDALSLFQKSLYRGGWFSLRRDGSALHACGLQIKAGRGGHIRDGNAKQAIQAFRRRSGRKVSLPWFPSLGCDRVKKGCWTSREVHANAVKGGKGGRGEG